MTDQVAQLVESMCDGEVCAACGLCETCGKVVRPDNIHLDYCACPLGSEHWLCPACKAKFIAATLAPYGDKPWWKS